MHLDDIVSRKRADWASADVPTLLAPHPPSHPQGAFTAALSGPDIAVIAEVKPASPSKGALLGLADAVPMARSYAAAGASAISVLADTPFFGGSPQLVADVAGAPEVTVPVLYKDFLVDVRQVELASRAGAAAVLVIARAVCDALLADLLQTARDLGLEALVETFTAADIDRALGAGAEIVGINNRDLQTFTVDLDNSARLRREIPDGILTVSESGIGGRDDLVRIADHGFDAALIGESLLTAGSVRSALGDLLGVRGSRVSA